jgi:hypothetical protein
LTIFEHLKNRPNRIVLNETLSGKGFEEIFKDIYKKDEQDIYNIQFIANYLLNIINDIIQNIIKKYIFFIILILLLFFYIKYTYTKYT